MQEVTIFDKTFVECIPAQGLETRIRELSAQLHQDYTGLDLVIICVLNGAFLFTADLVRYLDLDPEIHFVRVSSYGDETESSGVVRQMLGLDHSVKLTGRHVLVVEDIVDTGHTVAWLRKHLSLQNPASLKVASLLYKPAAHRYELGPEYSGFEIPNDFVVGYGLDYRQHGRQLPSLYKLKP